jgi:hypothetical protein
MRTKNASSTVSRVLPAPLGLPGSPGLGIAVAALLALLILPWLFACGEDIFKINWVESPDTVQLYALSRPELGLLSGFDFIDRVPVPIETPNATGQWDMVVDTKNGELVFLPPGAVGVSGSKAAIAPMGPVAFDDLRRAPSDTALYVRDAAVPVELGNTYVIRTRQSVGIYGQSCVYFGKLEPLATDVEAGTVKFVFDVSPVCNDRKLYPPKK